MDARIDTKVIGEFGYEQAMFGMGLSFGLTSGMVFKDFSPELTCVSDKDMAVILGYKGEPIIAKSIEGVGEKYNKMAKVIEDNCSKDGGHDKSLESIQIWLDVNAPRFWWSEADTYRLSTKQSESTMHTLVKQIKNMKFRYDETSNLMVCDELKGYIEEHFDCSAIDKRTISNILETIHFGVNSEKLSDTEKLVFAKGLLPESFLQRRIWNINYKTLRNIVLQRFNHRLPHWQKFVDDVIDQIQHPELIKKEMKAFGGLNFQKDGEK